MVGPCNRVGAYLVHCGVLIPDHVCSGHDVKHSQRRSMARLGPWGLTLMNAPPCARISLGTLGFATLIPRVTAEGTLAPLVWIP